MSALLEQLGPLITREVTRAAGTLPEPALRAEAKVWAIKAVKTFDPSKGSKLSTHVVNYLQKVRRMNYTYQNAARLPESKQLQFREFNDKIQDLENDLGRMPSEDELAKHLGWSKKNVIGFQKMLYRDFNESQGINREDTVHYRINRGKIFMRELDKDLTQPERELAALLRRGVSSNSRLQDELGGIPLSTLSYTKSSLKEKVLKHKGLLES